MGEVIEFLPIKYKQWAKQYVDIFEEANRSLEAANEWANCYIPHKHYVEFRPYVDAEFRSRGYELRRSD